MAATTRTGSREAIASACAQVDDGTERDAVDGVVPGLVARPTDVDQVSEVLRAAAGHGLTVVPRGRGTKTTWGAPPTRADVVVDVAGLDRVLDHAAGDLILATQAGATLDSVQQVAAEGDQRLTLDQTVAGASIGGILATNTSGARRVSVGTARDLLIGITLVRADGVVAKAGGRVVKNVAGYDLGKLLIGSFGTLGVIVDATFRLHPRPPASRWVSVPVTSPADALARAQAAVHSHVVPAAVEVEWSSGGGRVAVLLEGRPDAVEGRTARLRELLGPESVEVTGRAEQAPDAATYPWDPGATGEDRSVALKLTHRLSGLEAVLAAADETGATVRGSAGAGALYAALPATTSPEQAAAALDRLRTTCTTQGGSAVVLDAPASLKSTLDLWGPIPALDLMRRVKDRFDPDHRLAPARFVGGI